MRSEIAVSDSAVGSTVTQCEERGDGGMTAFAVKHVRYAQLFAEASSRCRDPAPGSDDGLPARAR